MLRMLVSAVAAVVAMLPVSTVVATSPVLNVNGLPQLDRTLVEITGFFDKTGNDTSPSYQNPNNGMSSDFVFGSASAVPTNLSGRYGGFDMNLGRYLMTEWKLTSQLPTSTDGSTLGARLQRLDETMTACAFVSNIGASSPSSTAIKVIANQVASQCKTTDLVIFIFVSALPSDLVTALKLIKMNDLTEIAPNPALAKTSQHSNQILLRLPSTVCMESTFPTSSNSIWTQVCRGKDCVCAGGASQTAATSKSSGVSGTGFFLITVAVVLLCVGLVSIANRYRQYYTASKSKKSDIALEKEESNSTPFLLVNN